jgi:hypothetical protein
MSKQTTTHKPSILQRLGSELFLGLLVTVMSVLTATINYATFQVSGTAAEYQTEGERALADSNTEYVISSQFVIQDYTMYDGFYINEGVDDFSAEYYVGNFSEELQASIDRGTPFDDPYYNEMYAPADELFDEAFEWFDMANAEYDKEAAYQLAMLSAAIGLAFAAYASLLSQESRLRGWFALMSSLMMAISLIQFLSAG